MDNQLSCHSSCRVKCNDSDRDNENVKNISEEWMLFRVEVLQKGWKSAGFLTVTVGILKYFQVFIWI